LGTLNKLHGNTQLLETLIAGLVWVHMGSMLRD
jgi:hypothetical protein